MNKTIKDYPYMREDQVSRFCFEFNSFLKLEFNYKRSFAYTNFLTISAFSKKFDLYLRWNSMVYDMYPNNIVITRFGFQEQRKGHGKSFLKFLFNNASIFGYQYIIIEYTNEKSSTFAKKMGFSKIDNMLSEHYVIEVDKFRNEILNN